MFNELHSMEKNDSVLSTNSHNINKATSNAYFSTKQTNINAESLFMCTEGLGCESFDDVEKSVDDQCKLQQESKHSVSEVLTCVEDLKKEQKRSRIKGIEFPPPISSIGMSECLKSYRSNGRFILREVRIPTQELLHACREDGRLKLQFVQSDDEVLYAEDEVEELENRKNGTEVSDH